MARFTKLIKFGSTPELLTRIRAEAQRRNISVSELIRTALNCYVNESNARRRILGDRADASPQRDLLSSPLVHWSPAEEQFAHQVLQKHFDEDR